MDLARTSSTRKPKSWCLRCRVTGNVCVGCASGLEPEIQSSFDFGLQLLELLIEIIVIITIRIIGIIRNNYNYSFFKSSEKLSLQPNIQKSIAMLLPDSLLR